MTRHKGFSLIELLVLLAILAILFALLLPAIQAARESARRVVCVNNLRQIGMALHGYHEGHKTLPAGWTAYLPPHRPWPNGEPRWGWAMRILPFLESNSFLQDKLHEDLPITHPKNQDVRTLTLAKYRCPSDKGLEIFEAEINSTRLQLAVANYLGVFGSSEMAGVIPPVPVFQVVGNGVFFHNSAVRFRDITDGLNCTLFVGEGVSSTNSKRFHTWVGHAGTDFFGKSVLSSTFYPLKAELSGAFGSKHREGANFLLGDGSVRPIPQNIDESIYHALSTRQNRDSIGDFLLDRYR